MYVRSENAVCSIRTGFVSVVIACASCLWGCATDSPNYEGQQTFDSPSAAALSLNAAARAGDLEQMHAIFGPEGEAVLSSGDAADDRRQRQVFTVAMNQGWTLDSIDSRTKELIVGHEQWPFPIPIVKDRRGWWFDTVAGKDEILARRIGRNELAAIGTLRAYVFAQREYAEVSRDGRPVGVYAQRVRSEPGKKNGLYWPQSGSSDPHSPLGEFAAAAAAEGYTRQDIRAEAMTPYHGYFFRILRRQGPDAPGGAMDYVVGADMTRGFAMIAFPAEYGNSGIMTFIVAADGVVYESDLGEDTPTIAKAIEQYNPDSSWSQSP